MAAKLVAEEGTLKGLTLVFENGEEWIVGRDPETCQLLIEDPIASRRHMLCRATPEGIIVENLSATNPVKVNKIEVNGPHLLRQGDLLKIGGGLYRFYEDEKAIEELPHEEISKEEISREEPTPEESEEEESFHQDDELMDELSVEESYEEEIVPQFKNEQERQETIEQATPFVEEEEFVDDQEEFKEDPFLQDESLESSIVEDHLEDESENLEHLEEPKNEDFHDKNVEKEEESNYEEHLEEEEDDDEDFDELYNRHDTIFEEDLEEDQPNRLAEIDFAIPETGRWLLKVISGPNTGAEYSMDENHSYLLGTDPNTCDLIFNDSSVSRQHVRLHISDSHIITIEDLRSKNGTFVDGKRIENSQVLESNVVVNLGTSAFVVFDKEAEMQTLISPLLPSIVKVLQKEEPPVPETKTLFPAVEEIKETAKTEEESPPAEEVPQGDRSKTLTAFILIAILTGTFVLMGIGLITLFQDAPVEVQEVADANAMITEALAPFPSVQWTYNKTTGTLMLVGHLLTDNSKRQLRYNLEGLSFVRNIDDTGIIIDERVWQQWNPEIAKVPEWRTVNLQTTAPGKFVLTGYLKTNEEMENLSEFLNRNFPYLDLLQNNILVEEQVINEVKLLLSNADISGVKVSMANKDLILKGTIPVSYHDAFESVLDKITKYPGLRNIQDFVTEIAAATQSTKDITSNYLITGFSNHGGEFSVIIDGQIVSKGDTFDGMLVTDITRQAMFLEKDKTKYRINLP